MAISKKGLTITLVTEAESLNYGEGLGNVSGVKKLTRPTGSYSYLSRQAICYNLKKQMNIANTPLEEDKVIQYAPDSTIADYPEIDLFGYFKTKPESKKRAAVVRVSNAISLEQFNADIDFLTNLNHFERYNDTHDKKMTGGSIANVECHKSYYTYTITIDLDLVGIDTNDSIEISQEDKIKRIHSLLDAVLFLNRGIRGREENLSPIFAIGGLYEIKSPLFLNRIELKRNNLNIDLIKDTINLNDNIQSNTKVAMSSGKFSNYEKVQSELNTITMRDFFNHIKDEVKNYYESC